MEGSGRVDRIAQDKARPDLGLFNRIDAQRMPPEKRVLRAANRTWENDIQFLVDASNGFDDRAVGCFLRRIPAGSKSDIHRHNFEALGYVVKGHGYEIHDGEKIEWSEGDAVFI